MQTYPELINEPVNKEYYIRRLDGDNIRDLALLHSEVYGTPIDEAYFRKKYDTAYTGIKHISFLAYNKTNLPIAFYGVIPCFLKYKNEQILAAQSADTMTHPYHRFKGMFVELSHITFDLCRQVGIRIVFGFPNQNSYHGAITKLGWKETGSMSCFTIRVKTLPLESISKKLGLFRLYHAATDRLIKKNLAGSDGILNSVIRDGFAGVDRSPLYLSWKNYSSTSVLKLDNSLVWISKRSGLIIGDMDIADEEKFVETIRALKKLAGKSGIKYLQFHCSQGTGLHQLFSSVAEVSGSFPVLFQDFGSPIPLEKIKFTFADIDIF